MKTYSPWLELRVGLWVMTKILTGSFLFLGLAGGLIYLYENEKLAHSIINWVLIALLCAVLLFIAIGGLMHIGEVELHRREREKINE